jgi:hypothetical protein
MDYLKRILVISISSPYHIIKLTKAKLGSMQVYHLMRNKRDYDIISQNIRSNNEI